MRLQIDDFDYAYLIIGTYPKCGNNVTKNQYHVLKTMK